MIFLGSEEIRRSRLCGVFVLLVVVVVSLCDASSYKCEQRERSLADLDQAEDALKKAKQLVPNCEEENDKPLELIDAALDLVSKAKKNAPICLHAPTPTQEPWTPTVTPEVTTEEIRRPMDCQDLLDAGHVSSGVYTVWPRGGKSLRVQCDMDTTHGEAWTVIQRRGNFWRQENFNRDWEDYKKGFGNLDRDFWIGNDNIFWLTNQGNYSLRLDMEAADGVRAYALFREFRIEDEKANYTLHVGGYSGTAGDSMYVYGQQFSTRDRKNNGASSPDCAAEGKGGWWYGYYCAWCNPNGLYKPGVADLSSMYYLSFKDYVGLVSFEMKIKRL